MPSVVNPHNLYSEAAAGKMSAAVAGAKAYVYVPSTSNGSVTVIDQATMRVVDSYKVGSLVQHVVPSWNLRTLYANASGANRLVPIDPTTGRPGRPIHIDAPYNLYFAPDGRLAVVMAERHNRIDYYDPTTWKLKYSVKAPCVGPNHADWSIDGRYFLVTCEFSGQVVKMDSGSGDPLAVLTLHPGAMPQDVRVGPDGRRFYVADMMAGGVWVLDGDALKITGFIHTGIGTHGLYPSRDAAKLYVSNRGRLMGDETRRSHEGDGSISVIRFATNTVAATWPIPGGGSPDMGGVSADGSKLWLSGRYDSVVYVFDTASGAVIGLIPVPAGPHGLCVWPQPGRYSLGHTDNTR
jgi:DNA-binding beta-propeller fold protein YncE